MTTKNVIQQYDTVIQGVVTLFAPFVEVAIHDLQTGKISAIYNDITHRKVGDISPIQSLHTPVERFPDIFDPYYEINWDGRKIKCTTVTIRDENKNPIAVICFNFDTSIFQDIQQNLKTFLNVNSSSNNPVELFNENWQEKIDGFITVYLTSHNVIMNSLSRDKKQKLIQELSKQGVFFYKNAASYVAGKLHISRATVYNYMKVLRAVDRK